LSAGDWLKEGLLQPMDTGQRGSALVSGKWREHIGGEWRSVLLASILGGAILVQLVWIGGHSGPLLVAKVWVNRRLDAISRSADAAYGYDYMQWINFLRRTIPEEATVFVVPTPESPQYTLSAFLEYFLMPRHVSHCPASNLRDCIAQVAGPGTCFLYTDGSGMALDGHHGLRGVVFDDRLGVLVPEQGLGQ